MTLERILARCACLAVALAIVGMTTCQLRAQTITLSPQGPEALRSLTGRRIPGFQLVAAMPCAPDDKPVEFVGGDVYRAATEARYAWQAPEVAERILTRNAGLNWRNVLIFSLQSASSVATMAMGGGIVSATGSAIAGAAIGHGLVDSAVPFVQSRRPDPQPVAGMLFKPDQRYVLPPGGCAWGYLGATFPSGSGPVTLAAAMDSPEWFTSALQRQMLPAQIQTSRAGFAWLPLDSVERNTRSDDGNDVPADHSTRFVHSDLLRSPNFPAQADPTPPGTFWAMKIRGTSFERPVDVWALVAGR